MRYKWIQQELVTEGNVALVSNRGAVGCQSGDINGTSAVRRDTATTLREVVLTLCSLPCFVLIASGV